jgi:hypothetical protein
MDDCVLPAAVDFLAVGQAFIWSMFGYVVKTCETKTSMRARSFDAVW